MGRKITRKGLIKKLDKVFSIYIRTRYAKNNIVQCSTCGIKKHWKEVDAGHFRSRRYMNTRWNPQNVFQQCKGCNNWGAGESYLMGLHIDKIYGIGTADELIKLSREVKKFTTQDLLDMIDEYKNLIN
tara:strand:+ start:1537 stop:1920 length:384 start_codon:yes stop_codon:yes gene_type:complete